MSEKIITYICIEKLQKSLFRRVDTNFHVDHCKRYNTAQCNMIVRSHHSIIRHITILNTTEQWLTLNINNTYCKISNISHTKSQNLNDSRLVLQLSLPNPIQARCRVKNEDVVGAAPTGDAPTTSEWSTSLLPTKVQLILEVWQYMIVNMDDIPVLVFHKEGFWLSAPSQCWFIIENASIFFMFSYVNSVWQGLTHYCMVTPYGDIDLGQHWLR